MYKYYFNVAKLNLLVSSRIPVFVGEQLMPFKIEQTSQVSVVYKIRIGQMKLGNECVVNKQDFRVINKDDTYIRVKTLPFNEKILETYLYSENEKADITLSIPKEMEAEHEIFVRTNIWNYLAFEDVLINHQAFILHSSFISWQNNGILFTAPSGTGKSTQADLWKKYEDADIYNGDRTIIRKIDGKYYGFGSPYAGSSGIYRNESAPIKAIIVIEQGPDNVIRRLRGREAFLPLFRETLMNTWNKEYMEKMTDLLMDAACQIPVYHLSCRPDQDAVNTVKNEILQEL